MKTYIAIADILKIVYLLDCSLKRITASSMMIFLICVCYSSLAIVSCKICYRANVDALPINLRNGKFSIEVIINDVSKLTEMFIKTPGIQNEEYSVNENRLILYTAIPDKMYKSFEELVQRINMVIVLKMWMPFYSTKSNLSISYSDATTNFCIEKSDNVQIQFSSSICIHIGCQQHLDSSIQPYSTTLKNAIELLLKNVNLKIRKEMVPCVCQNCEKDRVVGLVVLGDCYYIHINDRFSYAYTGVQQFTGGLDVDIADGLTAQLTSQFYSRFKYPVINYNFHESKLFPTNATSTKTCLKLDIASGYIYDDTLLKLCKEEPSIVKTDIYDLTTTTDTMDILRDYGLGVETESCADVQDSAVIGNNKCFYFMNVNEFCTIASIQTAEEYDAFERFVLHKSINVTKSICGLSSAAQSIMFYSTCVFSLHDNAYQTFVVHINPIFFKNEFIKTFFSLSRLDTGFYLVDIIRRRMEYFVSYDSAIDAINNRYGLFERKHLCEKDLVYDKKKYSKERKQSPKPIATTTSTTTMPIQIKDTRVPSKNQNSSTVIMIVLLCIFVFVAPMVACIWVFCANKKR